MQLTKYCDFVVKKSQIIHENEAIHEKSWDFATEHIPRVAIIAAKTTMPTGCTLNFPIGYL